MATRQAPRVPAGENSLAALAIAYYEQRKADDAFEELLKNTSLPAGREVDAASRAAWVSLAHNAQLIMRQPPKTDADMLITLGMALAYLDCVAGQLDGDDEVICRGVEAALHYAFNLLVAHGATYDMPVALSPLIKEFCRNTGATERGPALQAEAA